MAPMTAMSAPGTFFVTNFPPRITTSTETDTAMVVMLESPTWRSVAMSLVMVLSKSRPSIVTPLPSAMPSSPPT